MSDFDDKMQDAASLSPPVDVSFVLFSRDYCSAPKFTQICRDTDHVTERVTERFVGWRPCCFSPFLSLYGGLFNFFRSLLFERLSRVTRRSLRRQCRRSSPAGLILTLTLTLNLTLTPTLINPTSG